MKNEIEVYEYRYMDEIIKKNREIVLKNYLQNNDKDELQFYDLGMYHNENSFKSIILSQVNRSVIDKNIILNRYQVEILNILNNKNLFLSAPTSFGKTFLMLEFIKRNENILNNIVFIIPTLALMNELLKKLYYLFGDKYNICINSSEELKEKNIFVFVPERSDKEFIEKTREIRIDLLIFDEIYKLEASSTREIKTDDRLIYMNKVYLDLVKKASKIALLGPYINSVSFEKTKLDIVRYFTNYMPVYNKTIVLDDNDSWTNYIKLNQQLIYFSSPNSIYRNIEKILKCIPENEIYKEKYKKEISYLENNINKNWYVISLLKRGIGIHHGKTPMYLRKFFENEYNKNNIKILLCTNTLMEGINTPTNSMIIVDDPKSAFKLNNLMGRVGRLNVKNPVIGEIIIASESILSQIRDTSGWFELNILAETDEIITEDEIIYLNKKYEDNSKQKEFENKLKLLDDSGVTIDQIVEKNLQFDVVYKYVKNNMFDKLKDCNQPIDFVKICLQLCKTSPAFYFKTNLYNNLNTNKEYLPYKYYIVDLLLNKSYKDICDSFNAVYNVKSNIENINIFIDSLYALNSFIKFKLSKSINYIELNKNNYCDNTNIEKFIGILSNYKSLETAYKILEDIGINEDDSKKIIDFLNISNSVSTSKIIKLIIKNKKILLNEDLTPFTKNIIINL